MDTKPSDTHLPQAEATPHRPGTAFAAILLTLGLMAVALALLSTSRYGIGLSTDSVQYLSAARSLLAGEGFRDVEDQPWAAWPPLFPTLLAAIGLAGGNLLTGARFLNALAFGAIVLACARLFTRALRSRALAVLATATVALSVPLLSVSTMAWTEPVFILMVVLFVLYVPSFLQRPRWPSLVGLAILTALCPLQRYLGVAVLGVGAVLVVSSMPAVSSGKRFRYLLVLTILSTLPLALWAARNYMVSSTFTGLRWASRYSLGQDCRLLIEGLTTWFVPETVPMTIRLAILVLMLAAGVMAWVLGPGETKGPGNSAAISLKAAGLFVLLYTPMLILAHQMGVAIEPINQRYLAPLFVFVVLFAFLAVDRIVVLPAPKRRRLRWLRFPVVGLCSLWLIYPLTQVRTVMSDWTRDGVGGFSRTLWRESALIDWLQHHELEGLVYSNVSEALYVLADMETRLIPRIGEDMTGFQASVASETARYLVWRNNMPRPNFHGLEAVISAACMEEVATFPDGMVCRFVPVREQPFTESRIFSRHMINGLWCRTFTSETFGPAGVINSWILGPDGTTDSLWELHRDDGAVIRWRAACPCTLSGNAFEFTCRGEATESKSGQTATYVMSVRGNIDGDVATGTYTIDFSKPQWHADDRGTWRVDRALPVHRFWASGNNRHFYTLDEKEMAELASRHWRTWAPERVAFYAYPPDRQPPETSPVYRFWAPDLDTHFFTMSAAEKGRLSGSTSRTWRYEGTAFHAYPAEHHPPQAVPVYRLWSPAQNTHFYTTSISERDKLTKVATPPWVYEGLAWYAIEDRRP